MTKRTLSSLTPCVIFLVTNIALVSVFTTYKPNSSRGWARFRLEYGCSLNKSAYLDSFRSRIREHSGGYIPMQVAQFLNTRLESSTDDSEVAAITRFYSLQAGGREPRKLFDLSDEARKRVAATVLRDWKTYPAQEAQHGFVLLENLRKNKPLFKANVILPNDQLADSPEEIEPVARLFEKWNTKYRAVVFIQRPDPLKGTPYSILGT